MRVLLIEDHPLFRQGLALVLAQLDEQLQPMYAHDASAALALIEEQHDWDLVLLDLTLPDSDGFSLLQTLRVRLPATPIVILSASEEPSHIHRAMRCGAYGYIPKSSSNETLLTALRLVLAGTPYVPPHVLSPTEPKKSEETVAVDITTRQREVLNLLAKGLSNKQIAQVLGMMPGTVRIHMTAIFKALKVNNRTEAVFIARRAGLLGEDT